MRFYTNDFGIHNKSFTFELPTNNNRNTRKRCQIRSKLKLKAQKRRQ